VIAGAKVYDTVSLISSALAGAGGAFSAASIDTFAAIANALNGAGIDLTNSASVSALITGVAQTENISLASGVADNVASIVVASNLLLQSQTGSGAQLLNEVAAVELVSQGAASTAIQHAGNEPTQFHSIVDAFTGTNLNAAYRRSFLHAISGRSRSN